MFTINAESYTTTRVNKMADIFTKEKRSEIMARIQGKNTRPEIAIRSFLHRQGYRFRLHKKDLPGKPDIILPKYKTIIFVHGCYWHRHSSCKRGRSIPSTNKDFWLKKFRMTISRDKKNQRELHKLGWKVITFWECEVSENKKLNKKLKQTFRSND